MAQGDIMTLLLMLVFLSHINTNTVLQSLDGKIATASIRGQIVDLFGHPIRKTLIQIEVGETVRSFTTSTDDQGIYYIEGLPEGKHILTFSSRGFVTERTTVILKNSNETPVNIGFIAGYIGEPIPTEVTGFVLGEQKMPLEGATIVLQSTFNRRLVLSAQTGNQGQYKVSVEYPGQYIIYTYKSGYRVAAGSLLVPASLPRRFVKMDFTLPSMK